MTRVDYIRTVTAHIAEGRDILFLALHRVAEQEVLDLAAFKIADVDIIGFGRYEKHRIRSDGEFKTLVLVVELDEGILFGSLEGLVSQSKVEIWVDKDKKGVLGSVRQGLGIRDMAEERYIQAEETGYEQHLRKSPHETGPGSEMETRLDKELESPGQSCAEKDYAAKHDDVEEIAETGIRELDEYAERIVEKAENAEENGEEEGVSKYVFHHWYEWDKV